MADTHKTKDKTEKNHPQNKPSPAKGSESKTAAAKKKPAETKQTTTHNKAVEQRGPLKPSTLLSLIALIIALLALIEGFYLESIYQKSSNTETASTQTLTTTVQAQKQQITELNNQLKDLKGSLQNNIAQIGENEASVQTLKDTKDMNNNRWILIEVNHLLNMAQYNLALVPAPQTAIAILEKVNKQLTSLNAPKTLALRQNVTSILTELKALPKINYADTLMQLNSISDQLPQLPLVNNNASGQVQSLSDKTDETASGWRQYWHKTLATLEKLVVIRHQDQLIEPLISPKQQMFLVKNIQLKLSQASWAILQNNQKIFEESLNDAILWINKYYAPDAAATTSIVDALKTLKKINLQPSLPSISSAIELSSQLLNPKQKAIVTKGDKS